MRPFIVALAVAAVLAACESPSPSPSPDDMSGDEFRALLADGLTLNLGGPGEGYSGQVRLEPDGTGKGSARADDGTEYDITGTWEIEGDRFCRKWRYDDFKRVCETWRKTGPNKVDVYDGKKRIGMNSWAGR